MIYLYDHSFEGFLTVVFEIYSSKAEPHQICRQQEYQEVLFEQTLTVVTDVSKSDRVWQGLLKKLGKNARQ